MHHNLLSPHLMTWCFQKFFFPAQDASWENPQAKRARFAKAAVRKVRAVSGWNVFQGQKLQERGPMNPNEWKVASQEIASEWRAMSKADRADFCGQAAFDQDARNRLQDLPLPVADEQPPDLQLHVPKSALKKMSARRLVRNFEAAQEHPLWSPPGQLGDCSLACPFFNASWLLLASHSYCTVHLLTLTQSLYWADCTKRVMTWGLVSFSWFMIHDWCQLHSRFVDVVMIWN